MRAKRFVVIYLEFLCSVVDRVPSYEEGRWYCSGYEVADEYEEILLFLGR